MPEQVDIDSTSPRRPEDERNVAVKSGSETDPSLVALIRQALDASLLPPHPNGLGKGVGGESSSVNRIGKFEVLGEIGRGGFGTVLLVRDPDLGRERALKVPNPETLDSPDALARFLGEGRLASRVDHPNVVRVYEAETAGVLPYIVMEYCPGGSLGQWLAARSKQDHLPQRWVAGLVAEIAEGVHQAHLAGLLHRDIKPGNVLLERIGHKDENDVPQFRPKITDFGLAKVLEQDGIGRSMTVSGTPVGTWAYMSPEQARGEKGILATTDVYAIGAILYELLAGRRLYADLSQTEILGRLLGPDVTPSPGALRRDLHRDMETICLKCLEKSTGDRYQTPSELANDLRRFLNRLPILARPAPLWKRGLLRVKRYPTRSALTALTLTSIIAGAAAWSQFHDTMKRGGVDVLLNNLGSATVAQFPELIPQIDPTDPHVAERLNHLFIVGKPSQKLAAALVLAKVHPEFCEHCYEQLLIIEPAEIATVAHLPGERMPNLKLRLATDADTPSIPGLPEAVAEAHDLRRAHAALALLALDASDRGWSLLRFSSNPQARSLLIHLLGPSGLGPHRIISRLTTEPEVSIRRALIQSLGEIPAEAWKEPLRAQVVQRLLLIYENDPDAGVHGSVKWLLLRWARGPQPPVPGLAARLGALDVSLQRSDPDPRRSWRISPGGFTLIRIAIPSRAGGPREIEVADTEVTVAQFLRRFPEHLYEKGVSPSLDCPVGSVSWEAGARFCNRLSGEEGIEADDLCFSQTSTGKIMLVENSLNRHGYRLLTALEFAEITRSGTTSKRYFGVSNELLGRYEWHRQNALHAEAVASLKPNDLGLFDTLGNLVEWCDQPKWKDGKFFQAVIGLSYMAGGEAMRCDEMTTSISEANFGWIHYGFRVCRTLNNIANPPEVLIP